VNWIVLIYVESNLEVGLCVSVTEVSGPNN
jgi:hypothetical protein